MQIRKLCSILLSLFLFLSMGLIPVRTAHASQLQILETQPDQTEIPVATSSESWVPEFNATEIETQPGNVMEMIPAPSEQILETETMEKDPVPTNTQTTETPETENVTEPQSISEIELIADAMPQDDDLGTVSGQGISFRLFNYSNNINKLSDNTAWRPISSYFTFRNSKMEVGTDAATVNIPDPSTNMTHDQDGYTKHHATVERVLDGGYPILDLSRNADGTLRTDPEISKAERNLAYLFSAGDHAVTAYTPVNTILQQSGSHYWYDSANHAVDYDVSSNRFRLRAYAERNSTTATYGGTYGDFLPFTYTGGTVAGTTDDGIAYHADTENTDYWFGMTMQVNFFQTKDGNLGDQNMIFRFSGDDDVWVFVDDVLLLDLGGTHGTVNGSINFATGEIQQYLTWNGANATEAERSNGSSTSFPTSIRTCFDAAGRIPNGGWNSEGTTFSDYSEHTLKFFYLERGSAVANCSLDFRLPTLPDESLTVTKDLSPAEDGELREYIAQSLYYRFRVMKVDAEGNSTDEPFLTAGMTYELLQNGSKVGTGTVGEDHSFQLKAGQSAQFTQMLHKGNGATRYIVEEIMPDDVAGQYSGVEYLVSGMGGDVQTENNSAEGFTAFQTDVLSAEQTQTVTFRNRVDTQKLGNLIITKLAAPGTQIPSDLFFKMQVTLGEDLLPVGTLYKVGDERRMVEEAGVILIRTGETAAIEKGILSGTVYRITELSAALDGYRPTYTGVSEPDGELHCSRDGVSGTVPLAGTVHITVTNADYDFAVQIPINKQILDFQKTETFSFAIEQVTQENGGWQIVESLPAVDISVSDEHAAEEILTIGYDCDEEGIFYYRITEVRGTGNFLYDERVFLVEVTVSDGNAQITAIHCGNMEVDRILFVNRAVTSLTVTKSVIGGSGSMRFPFTVEVFLDGEPFALPVDDGSAGYTVDGNVLSFTLGHGESITLPNIPIGAKARVTEQGVDGFLVIHRLDGVDETQISGESREISFTDMPQTIHFINQTGFRLPHTGGVGTVLYTAGGAAISFFASALWLHSRSQEKGGKRSPKERI